MLYTCEIWAYRYLDELERVQLQCIKSLYNLPKTTPNSFVRMEYRITPIRVTVLKAIISFIINLLEMDNSRLLRVCYNTLYLNNATSTKKFGLINYLEKSLESINSLDTFITQDSLIIRKEKNNIINKFINKLHSEDVENILNSKYNNLFRLVSNFGGGEMYLEMNCKIKKIRVISQLRLSNINNARLHINNSFYTFDSDNVCLLCDLKSPDNLFHFLFHCQALNPIRSFFLKQYCSPGISDKDNFEQLFTIDSIQQINNIYNFCNQSVKIRSFVLSEF